MRWKTGEYTGWGRVLTATGKRARPEKVADLRATLKEESGPAIGNRRSYGDAALNSGGAAIDMTRLDRLIGFDAATGQLTIEAGMRLGEILRLFAPKGWIPAVMPGTGFATVGGAIANDVHGKNHHNAGTFGNHVLAMDILGVNGRLRHVTPDTAPDLFRATIGGLGQTGIILSATLQLKAAASAVMDVEERRVDSLDEFLAMLEHSSATYSVGWIDATKRGPELGRGILEEAEIGTGARPPKLKPAKTVPFDAPKFLMSGSSVRLFNHFYHRRIPVEGRQLHRPMDDFFFPLDRILGVNRLYGKSGFHQFQCVVPEDAAGPAFREMLERITKTRLASPLAVIKRMGDGQAGHLSFPIKGFTLAIDFQHRAETVPLIQRLDRITAEAGGRVYLAKDSVLSAERAHEMYDDIPAWAAIANKADPARRLETDLVRRLKMREGL